MGCQDTRDSYNVIFSFNGMCVSEDECSCTSIFVGMCFRPEKVMPLFFEGLFQVQT